jgi:hypothetical protein
MSIDKTKSDLTPTDPPRSKRNPLHLARSYPLSMKGRQEGKSLAIALSTISMAISKPYVWIHVTDHYYESSTKNGDFPLFCTIKSICAKLELEQMYFKQDLNKGPQYYIAFGDPK